MEELQLAWTMRCCLTPSEGTHSIRISHHGSWLGYIWTILRKCLFQQSHRDSQESLWEWRTHSLLIRCSSMSAEAQQLITKYTYFRYRRPCLEGDSSGHQFTNANQLRCEPLLKFGLDHVQSLPFWHTIEFLKSFDQITDNLERIFVEIKIIEFSNKVLFKHLRHLRTIVIKTWLAAIKNAWAQLQVAVPYFMESLFFFLKSFSEDADNIKDVRTSTFNLMLWARPHQSEWTFYEVFLAYLFSFSFPCFCQHLRFKLGL